MKILIVDDSRAMRTIVIRTLRQAGFGDHSVIEADDGVDALRKIELTKPDFVLSDWDMPDLSGIELLELLRKRGSAVKFGFVASEGSPEMRQRATKAGALFFINKPFTSDTFQQALGSLLARSAVPW